MTVSIKGRDRAAAMTRAGRSWTVPVEFHGRSLDLECRETLDELEALKDVWQGLEGRSPEAFGYFQSFDWCLSWSRLYLAPEKMEARARVYVLWDGADCVMIWPLMTRRISPAITLLVPLTAPMNQYSTLLYDPARFDRTAGRAVLEEIRRDRGLDAICLDHVPQSALLADILEGQGVSPEGGQQSSILDLSAITDWESHHRALPKKQRLQRNSRRNRLEKLGALDYRVYPAGSRGYADNIERCIALKQAWLRDTGRLGRDVFDPRFVAFLRDLGTSANEGDDGVYLHALTLDGSPIAMEIGMRFRDDYYCFLGAIDLAYQKYSPGKVQMESAQRWAIETGIRRFDFLNDPSAYKSSWTNATEPLTASYVPLTSLGRLYCHHWMAGLRPHMRSIYHRFGAQIRARLLSAVGPVQRLLGRHGGSMGLVLCCMP
ncbi:protein involved in cellulose biosynthesis (CelD)-like protein [Agrobacterium albertimagni AOL15]|uniref:Protein involved in cellulose biosynthesis (CelD)-like protein n=1 Tax=Agrobacterium albertimagni AOL15 TaxID=1156935 RepID=K2PB05_9HYPH|nr:GNAT family N-acetyltransferase [Agrobacterium albertimagni]EKF58068.1 protein involved in cellulose biosynthesis (CelD)-like protein [Agrobacterium albertimagni AOL15]